MNKLSDTQLAIIDHLYFERQIVDRYTISTYPMAGIIPRCANPINHNDQLDNEIVIMATERSVTGLYLVGFIIVDEELTTLKTHYDIRIYDHCDPDFPDNLTNMLKIVTIHHMRNILMNLRVQHENHDTSKNHQ